MSQSLLEEYERQTKKPTTALYMQRIFPYAKTMIVLTLVYLVVELSFGATLLDVAGQSRSAEDLKNVEFFGRCLSATAVILAIFGSMLKKVFHGLVSFRRFFFKAIFMAAIVFPAVFYGEEALIDHLVDVSDGQQRRNALWMTMIGERLLNGDVALDGIQFSTGESNRAEDKTFIALLPFWGSTVQDVTTKANKIMDHITQKTAEARVERHVGGDFYEKAYKPSLEKIHDIYNDKYVPGSNAYAKAINDTDTIATQYWNEYIAKLKEKGYRPNAVPYYAKGAIVREVQKRGLPVPDKWDPNDRVTFYKAAREEITKKAKTKFKSKVESAFGSKSSLEPGLSWNSFLNSADVQAKWKSNLGIKTNVRLRDNMSPAEVKKTVYEPLIKDIHQQIKKKLTASPEAFADMGGYGHLGKDSYRAVIVPPIALGFSMIGGLVHLVKLFNFILMLFVFQKKIRLGVVVTTATLLLLLPLVINNHITSSRLISNLRTASAVSLSQNATTTGLVWIVNSQSIFYPVNKTIRDFFRIETPIPASMSQKAKID